MWSLFLKFENEEKVHVKVDPQKKASHEKIVLSRWTFKQIFFILTKRFGANVFSLIILEPLDTPKIYFILKCPPCVIVWLTLTLEIYGNDYESQMYYYIHFNG